MGSGQYRLGVTRVPSPVSVQEFARLSALFQYGVLDVAPEPALDLIVSQLAQRLGVPVVQLVFADAFRLWTKAAVGVVAQEIPRLGSLADLLIVERPVLNIPDVLDDPICKSGILIGDPPIRAYAGVRLQSGEDDAIGVLSIADCVPRLFSVEDMAALDDAACQVMVLLESRRRSRIEPSTGALTRDAFLEQIEQVLGVTRCTGQALSLVVLDVSRFRTRLDTMKAGLGQIVLRRMADLGRDQVRRLDTFGRVREELFGVLLTDTDQDGAAILAHRLSDQLGQGWSALVPFLDVQPIGIGIALAGPHLDEAASLLAAAEQACRGSRDEVRPARVA